MHTESSDAAIRLASSSPVTRHEIARAVAHGTYKNVAAFGGGSHVMHTGVVGTGRVAFAGFGVFLDFIKVRAAVVLRERELWCDPSRRQQAHTLTAAPLTGGLSPTHTCDFAARPT